jgi:hypothetical protein
MPILIVVVAVLSLLAVVQVLKSRSDCRKLTDQEQLVNTFDFATTTCDVERMRQQIGREQSAGAISSDFGLTGSPGLAGLQMSAARRSGALANRPSPSSSTARTQPGRDSIGKRLARAWRS